jgi:hypothetical protein
MTTPAAIATARTDQIIKEDSRMGSTRFFVAILFSWMLAACGGGGSSSASTSAQTGTVTVTMADGPIDGYDKIIMVISEIRLLGDAGQDVLVLDEPKQIDFLALSNFSEMLIKREVVAGTYSKIRLILDSLTLIKTDSAGNVIQSDDVRLNGLQKVDINPQGTFQVRGGEEIIVNVDLDLDRSIHIVTTGNGGVRFRPVVFASISTQAAFDKLFRVEGTINTINGGATTMNVCDIRRVSDDGSHSPNPQDVCVFTAPNADTTYFDANANPLAGFGDLATNDPVVMYGKFNPDASPDTFVPAVIAIGSRDTFDRERGISSDFVPNAANATAPGTINLDEVSSICLLTPLQREVGVAQQTAVFSEDAAGAATRIARTDIERCRATEAEGTVVNPGAADEFLRSFVVLQGAPVVVEEELVGSLAKTATADHYTLTPPPPATGDQCVIVDDSTIITQIETVGGVATITHPTTVPVGVEISAIGARDSANCLAATEIVREM